MQYVNFGKTDMKVSEVSLGAMQINGKPGFKGAEEGDEALAIRAVQTAVAECGVNFIDTARWYHHSQERIAKALADIEDGEKVMIATKANELAAELSPDGDFVAYVSDITGRFEVYLARYPTGAGRRQVSVEGGMWPQWRGDGRELFYASGDSLVAVDVQLGDRHLIGAPRRLFALGPTLHSMGTGYIKGFDVSSDGERFLAVRPVEWEDETSDETRIVHVENWIREFE